MKQLTRSRDDKWIGGVCGGIGQHTDIDPNLIRLTAVVLAILGFGTVIVGTVIVGTVIAWLLMPRAGRTVTVVSPARPADPVSDPPAP
jgi:phage shock protein PspC (stress-responsive transcriptional regulator)